ncbi:MAG: M3 family metallopeptidase [Bacteroidota bacterium]
MKKIFLLMISACLAFYAPAQNPLLVRDNSPINYPKINAEAIRTAVADVKISSDQKIAKIIESSKNQTLQNTLMAYDEVQYEISDLSSRIGLVAATYANDDARNTAFSELNNLLSYANNIYLNEPLYKAMKQFQDASKAKPLSASENKFLTDIIIAFEKNGMKLDETGKKELSQINDKLLEFGNAFDQNIAASKDSLLFTEADLKGVAADDIKEWKQPDGKYLVHINGPNYAKVIENADNGGTRKIIYTHYNNRAYPANLTALDSLLYYRNVFAKKLGFSSYAAYAVIDKMSATPKQVWDFENDLIAKLTPLVTEEVNTLKAFKKQSGDAGEFNAWDYAYYTKKMLNSKYQLNTDEVTEYFEMNNTLKGMFLVYEKILGIQIKETTGLPVWDAKVKSYDMFKDGQKTGTFYLDLFPRPNKYTHFECNPLSQYRKTANGETLPVAVLICNFPEGTSTKPSLLKHSDVITLFHEFGHLVHWELCHPAITSQNAFGTKGDFVEAPSQFLENWCWEYDALKLFAKHYKTGAVLPQALFNKMKQTQLVNSGSNSIRQVYLGVTDFTYEDRYDEARAKGLVEVSKEKFGLTQLPFADGTHYICSFGHLSGYGANYYGYLWSKVYAQDMFSVFQKNGVMDQATGIRYRKEVLEKGSSDNEKTLVENFLGRKPDSKSFLQSLGVK